MSCAGRSCHWLSRFVGLGLGLCFLLGLGASPGKRKVIRGQTMCPDCAKDLCCRCGEKVQSGERYFFKDDGLVCMFCNSGVPRPQETGDYFIANQQLTRNDELSQFNPFRDMVQAHTKGGDPNEVVLIHFEGVAVSRRCSGAGRSSRSRFSLEHKLALGIPLAQKEVPRECNASLCF